METGDRPLVPEADRGPASFLFPQLNKLRNGHKALRVFCSEDEQSRTCWLAAFRLFKVRPRQDLWHEAGVITRPSGSFQNEGASQPCSLRIPGPSWSHSSGIRGFLIQGQRQSPAPRSPGLGAGVPQPRPQHLRDLRFFLPPTPQYGVQLYRNYQLAQSRHLHPSGVASPPLVSVHREVRWGCAPRPHPRDTWAVF